MNMTEPFVLKDDVVLIPCTDLSDDMRARISYEEGDYTLSRRHGRTLAQVVDGETAALLSVFREPHTIADAVIAKSRAFNKDPEVWLDELLPHLGRFLQNRVLVPAGSEEQNEIRPQFDSGARIGRWEIVRCANLVEDSEVYQLRDGDEVAALKIARVTTPNWQSIFENEIEILRHLDGDGAPRVIETGQHEGRPYFVAEWASGVDAAVAAAQRRHDRVALMELCASIAATYATLHARGVLHADVHPRNVIAGGKVTLVDFGFARFADREPRVPRGGLFYFFEPEYVAGRGVATPAGEQYAVAALLYLLLTGKHYIEFRYDREEMEQQIREEPPLPFAARGIAPWPEVEPILFRALAKAPAARFSSMAELAKLLAAARDAAARELLATPVTEEATALVKTTIQSFAPGGAMFETRYPTPPRATINYGCAGAAVGLLRIAETRSDAELLSLADVWRSRAEALIGTEGAYYDDDELRREILGDVTPYHTEAGIHAAAAMIAYAMGDELAQRAAIAAFMRASNRPCAQLDLTLGRSGTLLASAMLLAISNDLSIAASLRAFGSDTMSAIWKELDSFPPIESSPRRTYLGMAHGWAGYLYAALRWCEASGDAPPARLTARLHELAALKISKGRGVYWRTTIESAPNGYMPGWCNGSAGHLFLWTLAHRQLGDRQWLDLAELAAWNTWDEQSAPATLCCGSAGRAYALLSLYKHTGATEWLSRARHLANHAAAHAGPTSQRENSLWKGELGVVVLIADLASPEGARMPFFE